VPARVQVGPLRGDRLLLPDGDLVLLAVRRAGVVLACPALASTLGLLLLGLALGLLGLRLGLGFLRLALVAPEVRVLGCLQRGTERFERVRVARPVCLALDREATRLAVVLACAWLGEDRGQRAGRGPAPAALRERALGELAALLARGRPDQTVSLGFGSAWTGASAVAVGMAPPSYVVVDYG
jgi:hypothetical protein